MQMVIFVTDIGRTSRRYRVSLKSAAVLATGLAVSEKRPPNRTCFRKEPGIDADDCRCAFFSYALCRSKSIWDSLAKLLQEVSCT